MDCDSMVEFFFTQAPYKLSVSARSQFSFSFSQGGFIFLTLFSLCLSNADILLYAIPLLFLFKTDDDMNILLLLPFSSRGQETDSESEYGLSRETRSVQGDVLRKNTLQMY